MRIAITLLAASTLLVACATPTPYQQAGESDRYGYSEQAIEADRYRITFAGNSLTDRETVETYLLYRAAELSLERGFEHFTVVDRATDEDRRGFGYHDPFYDSFFVRYRYYHPRFGWYGYRDPFWDDEFRYREVTRYEASAEIVMGRSPTGDEARDFNAREVLENLGPNIVRPEDLMQ